MPQRKTAVLVGLLFISSTVTFAAGSSLVQAYFSEGESSSGTLFVGVFLQWYTALAVASIGIALFPVLKPHGKYLSAGYLLLRVVEGMAIIAIGAYFLTSRSQFEKYDLLVYTLSGTGGLILSHLLLRSGLVAKWLSLLGVAGYAALLAGVLADALGAINLDSGAGAVFLVPGGLFEVLLPLLLIFRGFRSVEQCARPQGNRPGVASDSPGG
ncbi:MULTISPECIES: DUF4386 domain-containing protein [Streptomyces]|uniref:Integral membrane protein n=1 Tax=Streptomyces chrestomyceticus JCM 4735 TaxID=1306181 RepID=A0A7U9L360_9ACTN|nr:MULTISPECIES: DUF4386 domain-containing protein [Streptomyces]GCD39572.1 hypothetical protein OEIGOIKO_07428 [Streptomyces chrestomyceticus JCM 4735]